MSPQLLLAAILLFLLTPSIAAGQTYVTIAEHRVPFERVDTLQQLLKESRPVVAEAKRAGGIIDDVWLIHRWAGEYNVVNITTYKSWAAIEDTTLGLGAAQRKVFPHSAARKKINDRFTWVFKGVSHRDNIYVKAE
jgi:hypothetical protein